MHKIDIHNYEAYLLDYSEGTLSEELQLELELFLIQRPELNICLDELCFTSIESEAISFSQKNQLKKTEANLVSATQFIGYIENQLTETERFELEKSCHNNPALGAELLLFKNTLLKADTSVVFTNKQTLKRKPKVIWFNFNAAQYAAAACVLLLIGLIVFWPKKSINTAILANKTDNQTEKNISTVSENSSSTEKKLATQNLNSEHTLLVSQPTKKTFKTHAVTQSEINNNNNLAKNTAPPVVSQTTSTNQVQPEVTNPERYLALAEKQQTVVQVISESDDEPQTTTEEPRKKGLWEMASRTLKNLNNFGVKSVNGNENDDNQKSAYALTIGGLSITHKSGKL